MGYSEDDEDVSHIVAEPCSTGSSSTNLLSVVASNRLDSAQRSRSNFQLDKIPTPDILSSSGLICAVAAEKGGGSWRKVGVEEGDTG